MSNEAYEFNTYDISGIYPTFPEKFEGAATVGNKVIFGPHSIHTEIVIFDITSK